MNVECDINNDIYNGLYTNKNLNISALSSNTPIILICHLATPIAAMLVSATAQGICLLDFGDQQSLEKKCKHLQRLFKAQIIIGNNVHIEQKTPAQPI